MKLVSFYCDVDGDNFYTRCAEQLKKQCDDLKIPNLILHENFGNNWIDNVRAKPKFLLKIMNQLNEDFFWLDVDSNIHKKIDFNFSADWMSDIRGDNKPEDYVHFIKNTQQNKEFIVKWINEINKRNTGPGRGSHPAFIKLYSSLNFTKLPPGYVSMGISNVDSKQTYFNNGNIKTHKLI